MKSHRCCEVAASGPGREAVPSRATAGDSRRAIFARRSRELVEWMIPGVILTLMPKCPACLAAYVALTTGVGLSMSTAAYLRTLLVILCIASLSYLTARLVRRIIASHSRQSA